MFDCFFPKDKPKLVFSNEALEKWANLYTWQNKIINQIFECYSIDDGNMKIKPLKCKENQHPQFMLSLVNYNEFDKDGIGENINSCTKIVSDPVHLVMMIKKYSGNISYLLPIIYSYPDSASHRVKVAEQIIRPKKLHRSRSIRENSVDVYTDRTDS